MLQTVHNLLLVNTFEQSLFDKNARSNVNAAWGAVTMEVLARLGIATIVISPGSRSTPLTLAASNNTKLNTVVVLDERTAGFIALGEAKRSHKPVALICTSGTAAVNYYPAVIEASLSGTPLVVLTADRPPEYRNCSSGQTIDQINLYAASVRSFTELALPEISSERLAYLRQSLVHAVDRALHINPGPVHLNFPFREPLIAQLGDAPIIDAGCLEKASTVITRLVDSGTRVGHLDTVAIERLTSHHKGLIVVGDINPQNEDDFTAAVAVLSKSLGWPVLADVLNPLRAKASTIKGLICNYDRHLSIVKDAAELLPTAVLQIGTLPTSKILRAWLEQIDATHFILADRPFNSDPLHREATILHGDVSFLVSYVTEQKPDSNWLNSWIDKENSQAQSMNNKLEAVKELFEGKAAWLLSKHVHAGSSVFLASSMSVRYAEWFWSTNSPAGAIYSNRGANGIDGTLGTAIGIANNGPPTVLLTGDLAFLHDTNALLSAKDFNGSLTVILINNNGGGIFEHLQVSSCEGFEEFFATPQHVEIEKLCIAYSVRYKRILNWESFTEQLHKKTNGLRVLELKTDRKFDSNFLKEF